MHSQRRIPDDLSIRFLNPRGLLLIGGCELDEDEQRDFALICRDDLSPLPTSMARIWDAPLKA